MTEAEVELVEMELTAAWSYWLLVDVPVEDDFITYGCELSS